MKSCLKAFRTSQSTAGFTLIELLVAMAISTLVIGIAGFGLVTILDKNNKAEAETLRRTNLNRALDFIADDIRESKSVSTTLPAAWTSWTVPTGYTGVLFLTKPGTPTQVAYYTRSSSGVVWQGPQVIYRSTVSDDGGNALIDSLAVGGFTASVTNLRQVNLSLQGQACIPPTADNTCTSPKTFIVSTKTFARSAP